MIFVVCTESKIDNHELVKQAMNLTRKKFNFFERQTYMKALDDSKRGEIFTSLDTTRPLARLKPNEKLYVVGHGGGRDNPLLSGLKPMELANLLISHGLMPSTRGLRINLVCCHSGYKRSALRLSYAEQLYSILYNSIHELDRHHLEKEESLFKIKAPQSLIGFRSFDGKAIGIKSEDYDTYHHVKEHVPDKLDTWLKEHVIELSGTHYQRL